LIEFSCNIAGGTLLVFGAFVALLISGRLASGVPADARHYFPFVFGSLVVIVDLAMRIYGWRRVIARDAVPSQVTREGGSLPERSLRRELGEALFWRQWGAQYFLIIPAWVVGIACLVAGFVAGS
jgi:branched-subunit amino acid ABC-type transport system permease component